MYRKIIIISAILVFTLPACLAQNDTDYAKKLSTFVSKQLQKKKVTGLSVALSIDGKTVLSEGFGFAHKEKNIRARAETQYAIGSISKVVTSTAVLRLYSEGKIDIDKPYKNYVPEFNMKRHFADNTPVTVRHLLAHFGGIPRVHAKGFSTKDDQPQSRILEIANNGYMSAPPGVVNQYSDWGSDLLGLLVEKVSGQKIQDYVSSQVFKPLGMEQGGFGPLDETGSYVNGKLTPTYEYSYPGSDGANASAQDLMKLGQMYLNKGRVNGVSYLSEDITRQSLTPQFTDAPLNYSKKQGLMWDIYRYSKYTRISKGGIHEPFFSMLYIVPEFNMVLAVCSNSNSTGAINRAIYGNVIDHLLKTRPAKTIRSSHHSMKPEALSDQDMNKLEGIYSTDEGMVEIKRAGDKFKVTFAANGKTLNATPYNNKTLRIKAKLLGLIPVHVMDIFWDEYNGEIVVGEQYASGRRSVGGVKIVDKPIPSKWKAALGKYAVVNLKDNEYAHLQELELLINEYGLLEVKGEVIYPRSFKFRLPLSAVSEKQAIIPGYSFDFFSGETVEMNTESNKPTLLFSGYKFQKQ